jgi:hypothetical protein
MTRDDCTMGERAWRAALRRPGQYARSRGLELALRSVLIACAALLAMAVAWTVFGLRGMPLLLIELVALGVMLGGYRLYSAQADRWLRGAEGERAVAAVLAQLEDDGWLALHDISLGRGNVDHVLVGPGGIFTIETKSHSGRIPVDRIYPKMLKQAYSHKKLLENVTGLSVQPLLVFSRAYLVGHVPAKRQGVTVLPARMLPHYFSRRKPILEASQSDSVYQRLTAALSTGS